MDKSSINIVGVIAFACFVLGFVAFLVRTVKILARPTPMFAFFICHHKKTAGALSRLLQIKCQQRTTFEMPTFIDADYLANLNVLFDTVRCYLRNLVVALHGEVLTRPWCAGEITTAIRNQVPVIPLRFGNFEIPTISCPEDLMDKLNLDYATSGLVPLAIDFCHVSKGISVSVECTKRSACAVSGL